MILEKEIPKLMKSGRRYKLTDITKKINLLNGDLTISKSDIFKAIKSDLNHIIKYDEETFTYYIKSKKALPYPTNEIDSIRYALVLSEKEMTSIDIKNFIKNNFRKTISILDIEVLLLTDLKNEIGITKTRPIRYYLYYKG